MTSTHILITRLHHTYLQLAIRVAGRTTRAMTTADQAKERIAAARLKASDEAKLKLTMELRNLEKAHTHVQQQHSMLQKQVKAEASKRLSAEGDTEAARQAAQAAEAAKAEADSAAQAILREMSDHHHKKEAQHTAELENARRAAEEAAKAAKAAEERAEGAEERANAPPPATSRAAPKLPPVTAQSLLHEAEHAQQADGWSLGDLLRDSDVDIDGLVASALLRHVREAAESTGEEWTSRLEKAFATRLGSTTNVEENVAAVLSEVPLAEVLAEAVAPALIKLQGQKAKPKGLARAESAGGDEAGGAAAETPAAGGRPKTILSDKFIENGAKAMPSLNVNLQVNESDAFDPPAFRKRLAALLCVSESEVDALKLTPVDGKDGVMNVSTSVMSADAAVIDAASRVLSGCDTQTISWALHVDLSKEPEQTVDLKVPALSFGDVATMCAPLHTARGAHVRSAAHCQWRLCALPYILPVASCSYYPSCHASSTPALMPRVCQVQGSHFPHRSRGRRHGRGSVCRALRGGGLLRRVHHRELRRPHYLSHRVLVCRRPRRGCLHSSHPRGYPPRRPCRSEGQGRAHVGLAGGGEAAR